MISSGTRPSTLTNGDFGNYYSTDNELQQPVISKGTDAVVKVFFPSSHNSYNVISIVVETTLTPHIPIQFPHDFSWNDS